VEQLGINRKSMYAEFGSKQALFEAALRLYNDVNVERNFGPLEAEGAGLEQITSLLTRMGDSARGPTAGLGCLLCNTAVERASADRQTRKYLRSYVDRMSAAFRHALGNACASGTASDEMSDETDIDAVAGFLVGHILGQFTLIRANVAPEVVEASAAVAIDYVRAQVNDG